MIEDSLTVLTAALAVLAIVVAVLLVWHPPKPDPGCHYVMLGKILVQHCDHGKEWRP